MPQLVYDGRTYELTDAELVLGRHVECQIFVRDGRASRRNTRVFRHEDGGWSVEDLDSANGTRVNGEDIFSPHRLVHGDVVSIGKARIWFSSERSAQVDHTDTTPGEGLPVVPAEKVDPLVGTTCGSCLIKARIGSGFMGTMYRAEMVSTGRAVALRLYPAEFAARDAGFPQRVLEAIRAVGRFSHPDLVPILDCGVLDQRPWYAMELVQGISLGERIDRDGRLSPRQAVEMTLAIARILAASHAKGLCHLTLSPASILVDDNDRVRLVDLGLGAALAGVTDKRHALANPWHAAPEQRSGEGGDQRSDIYSIGAVLYHLLTGDAPGNRRDGGDRALERKHVEEAAVPTVCDQIPELPKRTDEILAGALARLPAWRYAAMEELVTDLTRLLEQLTAPVRGGRPAPRPVPPPRSAAVDAAPKPAPHAGPAVAPVVPRRASRPQGSSMQWLLWVALIGAAGFAAVQFGFGHQSDAEATLNTHLTQTDAPRRAQDYVDPLAVRSETTPAPTTLENDSLVKRWRTIEEQIDRYASINAWPRVDKAFQDFLAALPANAPETLRATVREQRQKLSMQSEQWYQARYKNLPDQLGPRWVELTRLRDQVPAARRDEVNLLLRETGVRLDQEITALHVKAGRLLESGSFDALNALAGTFRSLPPDAVVGRRVQALRTQLTEVQALKSLWQTDWATTRQALGNAQGEGALAKAAALFLVAADTEAMQALATIADGNPLAARRDRLLGMNVTDLRFAGPGDLQMLEMLQGTPVLADQALSAPPGTPCGLACTAPLSGKDWQTEVVMEANASGETPPQLAISLKVDDQKPIVQLLIAPDACTVRVHGAAGNEQFQPGPPTAGIMRLGFICRDGALIIKDRDETLAETKGVVLPAGTRLTIDITGMEWRMTQLRVVAAP